MTDAATWEGVASWVHEATGLDDPPVDALEVAALLKFGLRYGPTARLDGRVIYVPRGVRPVRMQGLVMHEVAHGVLRHLGEPDDETSVDEVATRIMLPRKAFDRQLRETNWHLSDLQARNTNTSAQRIAHRITHMRDAVVSIYDNDHLTERCWSPWLEGPNLKRVSNWERALVRECYATEQPAFGDTLVHAWPLFDGSHRRVVLVAEAEQLSFRWAD